VKTIDWIFSGALIIAVIAVIVSQSSKTSDAISSFVDGLKQLINVIMNPSATGQK
jgi:hypothetical protein